MKTSELVGTALDWAVAKCKDFREGSAIIRVWNNRVTKIIPGDYETSEVYTSYAPSTDWSQGGPIIERTGMIVGLWDEWEAKLHLTDKDYTIITQTGSTPLIAAMRCYVMCKLGSEVTIPKELLK